MLLSIRDSYILPSNRTLSPFMYGLVLLGCSHSGITLGSGINTLANKLCAAVGVQFDCEV